MFETIVAIFLRIISNPIANSAQKALAGCYPARYINFLSYSIMALATIPFAIKINWAQYSLDFWLYVVLAGFLCALGTNCLIKALSLGELSIVAPINSYKCVIGLVSGFFVLGEIPSLTSIVGLALIVWGSRELFKETKSGFSFQLFKEEYFRLRIYALILTGIEASFLKKIIIISSPMESFILWVFSGAIFTFLFLLAGEKTKFKNTLAPKNIALLITIPIMLSIMQISTNYVFEKIEVSLALALFQLSSIVSLIFGIVFFKEKNIKQKLIGTILMIIGAIIILIN
ncbi:EamA family transporter [bacterium]|nr:EamA family transporter [bacterium]